MSQVGVPAQMHSLVPTLYLVSVHVSLHEKKTPRRIAQAIRVKRKLAFVCVNDMSVCHFSPSEGSTPRYSQNYNTMCCTVCQF